ncbi:hypothetical protein MBCUT_10180 [Methanobrevibacter cuticularis]|uniref:Uncharacterized protein n=1 Tax=Methanobrevibacter cuticularis TaxID=47311 RepID=A0A166E0S7_9EURY|nr:hypothetical protein [Methanobrevibacter cuticularis]KZX16152.1 hypothetical protein MBCUT_10180 [Methanobrevibacter cuticularis]
MCSNEKTGDVDYLEHPQDYENGENNCSNNCSCNCGFTLLTKIMVVDHGLDPADFIDENGNLLSNTEVHNQDVNKIEDNVNENKLKNDLKEDLSKNTDNPEKHTESIMNYIDETKGSKFEEGRLYNDKSNLVHSAKGTGNDVTILKKEYDKLANENLDLRLHRHPSNYPPLPSRTDMETQLGLNIKNESIFSDKFFLNIKNTNVNLSESKINNIVNDYSKVSNEINSKFLKENK